MAKRTAYPRVELIPERVRRKMQHADEPWEQYEQRLDVGDLLPFKTPSMGWGWGHGRVIGKAPLLVSFNGTTYLMGHNGEALTCWPTGDQRAHGWTFTLCKQYSNPYPVANACACSHPSRCTFDRSHPGPVFTQRHPTF